MRKRFTKWYFKRGYRFGYNFGPKNYFSDDLVDTGVAVWDCPWWVKPLLIFFSPSVYFYELGDCVSKEINEGLKQTSSN